MLLASWLGDQFGNGIVMMIIFVAVAAQLAKKFGNAKAEFTIREYCRLGRLRAEKRQSGRGAYPQWVLSHAELERYQREGLLRSR